MDVTVREFMADEAGKAGAALRERRHEARRVLCRPWRHGSRKEPA
ncbi:hypothetical protein [Nonomuraea sp. NPDC050202]